MLPEISLDVDNFEDLVSEYRNMIASIYPEWTDYNYHDPGITLLELCAWLKEIQQFHLDQIGEEHKRKYLKLLGMKPLYRTPAHAVLEVKSEQNQTLLKGTKFYADDICFETEEKNVLIGRDIIRCITDEVGTVSYVEKDQLQFHKKLKIYPFGKNAPEKSMFYLQCSKGFPLHEKIKLSVSVYNDYPVKRNVIHGGKFYPLADVVYEYFGEKGWTPFHQAADGTYGLIQDGEIVFSIAEPMEQTELYGKTGFYIRIRLIKSYYEVAPAITGISFNHIKLIQRDSLCSFEDIIVSFSAEETIEIRVELDLAREGIEELYYGCGHILVPIKNYKKEQFDKTIVFYIKKPEGFNTEFVRIVCYTEEFLQKREISVGNGFPGQRYDLKEDFVSYKDFEIIVEDAVRSGIFVWWHKVDDFHSSLPEDHHYCLDEEQGELIFGNSIRGMAPEGRILIVSYAACFGARGNVKAGKINNCGRLSDYEVSNIGDAQGGRDKEEIQQSFLRARKMLKNQERAVTIEDYEKLVLQVPGLMIHSCKGIPLPEENAVGIFAKPFSATNPKNLNEAYRNNIMNYLDSRRLLGTKILIYSIEYIELSICAEVKAMSSFHGVKELAELEIRKFLSKWEEEFGKPILFGTLYGHIDSLPYINEIRSLLLEVKGNRTKKNQNGDVIPPANGIFLIKNVDCIVASVS